MSGEKYKDIAASMGISGTRARQMAVSYESLLTRRAVNVAKCALCGLTPLAHKSRGHEFVVETPRQ